MKALVLLDDIGFIRNNLEKIRSLLEKEDAQAVPLSDPAYFYLTGQGVKCLSYHDFESPGMYSGIYAKAREWGINWYKPNGRDWTEADCYSLGHLFEWSMIHFFIHLLRVFLSLEAVLRNNRPERVIVLTVPKVNVFGRISRWKHIDISLLPQLTGLCLKKMAAPPVIDVISIGYGEAENISNWNLKPLREISQRWNLLFSGLIRLSGRFLGKKKSIVFFEGFRHFEHIIFSPLLRKFQVVHLQKSIGLSLLWKLYLGGVMVESLGREKTPRHPSSLVFDPDGLKRELADYFIFKENDLFAAVWPRLEGLLTDFFPGRMYQDLLTTVSKLKKLSPHCMVAENDNTYCEKMIICAAKKLGIRTVVVQHGETWIGDSFKDKDLSTHDFYPLIADIFLAYGKVNSDWLKEMGLEENRIRITGSPRFDSYYRDDRQQHNGKASKKRVLILLNDFGFNEGVVTQDMPISQIYRHLLELLKLARALPEIDFIVRPHSKEHLWGQILKDELTRTRNLTVSRQGTLVGLLKDTGLVMGYLSTAMVEALIHRIPVISLDIDGNCAPFALWEYGLSKRVTSFRELGGAVQTLLFDQQGRARFLEEAERKIALFNYADDGAASKRIAWELKEILADVAEKG